jgi:quinol monooxygenase YgiN
VPVSPDDDDNIHLRVIEEWAHTPQGAASMQNPGVAALINKHTQIHIQSEQMKNGIQAQKAAGSQGSLGDPRAAKVANSK